MIELLDIFASYRETPVLAGVSLQFPEGKFIGVIGPNGAGKTTLLKVMSGVKMPQRGEVMLNGTNLNAFSRKEIARIMAVVPQSSFIPPLFSVEDVVFMGRYPRHRRRFSFSQEDGRAVEEAMRKTNTLRLQERPVNEISGGERQEVIIARALAQEPRVLLLDEPTANLDIKHQLRILSLIRGLIRGEGLTAVMVIHDLNIAARFCDKLVLLHGGRVFAQGGPGDVLTPKNLSAAYEVEAQIGYNKTIGAFQVLVINGRCSS